MMRTASCGQLDIKAMDREVILAGWVDTYRDHGELIFVDLRDRWGVTQIVFSSDQDPQLHEFAQSLRSEYVIRVKGRVRKRPEGTINTKLATGEVEVLATELKVLNSSPTLPFELNEPSVNEELRLKYRFIDLRREPMVKNLTFRYRVTKIVRDYLDHQGFLEIETPCLTRSTPEGARDYLVPSRLTPHAFYALPQSPQLFKQLIMVAGYDRYFQLARCFRDEDLRKDRQPEHTQIDMEMSFVDEEDIMGVVEGMVADVIEKTHSIQLAKPFRRIPYAEALSRFGSDKPDLRFEMELRDLTSIFENSGFKIFDTCIQSNGKVRGICLSVPGGCDYSRKDFDNLAKWIQGLGVQGLAWFKVVGPDKIESPIEKFFDADRIRKVLETFGAKAGDVILMVATDAVLSATALGALRVYLAEKHKLIPKDKMEVLWVRDFPMFEWNEDEKRYDALHHPFTSPLEEDIPLLDKDPSKVRARAYDLVLNGTEIGGGSIRIHHREVQEKVFQSLKISKEEAQHKFGFLLKALSYGAPPHGGIALGLDRFVAMLLGKDSIREVIAFPKTQKGTCLMTEAPSAVDAKQLRELHLNLKK